MKWIAAIIVFGFLILFHEFGHFIVARLNGIKVEEFSIGFGPRLLSTVKGGTRFSLKVLPFGGSCIMKGMYEELDEEYAEEEKNSGMTNIIDEGDSFTDKNVWQRAAVIIAGPFFNLLLAFIAAVILISVMGYDPAYVTDIVPESPAAESGLLEGDRVTSINGSRVSIERDVSSYTIFHELKEDEDINLTIERDGEKQDISFSPYVIEKYMIGISYYPDENEAEISEVTKGSPAEEAGMMTGDVIISVNGTAVESGSRLAEVMEGLDLEGNELKVGIRRGTREKELTMVPEMMTTVYTGFYCYAPREKTSPIGVIKYSFKEVGFWIKTVVGSLKMLFTGRSGIRDLSGPVGVVTIVSDTYEESVQYGALITFMNMLYMLILLSANVGVMNLLPVPALDGGRLLFLIVEMITGRKASQKIEAAVNFIGFVLLMILMLFVLYYDIGRIL